MDFAEPVSAKQFLGSKIDRSIHSLRPISNQYIAQIEKDVIPPLAHEIIRRQQQHAVVSTFNILAILLTNSLSTGTTISATQIANEARWLKLVLEVLGANTTELQVENTLKVHTSLVRVDDETSTLCLVQEKVVLDQRQLKGYRFPEETMTKVVPMIMLQIYVNTVLHFIISPALVVTLLKRYKSIHIGTCNW